MFGKDRRQLLASDKFPGRTIGYIVNGGGAGTGTLVYSDIVLTAGHVIFPKSKKPICFYLGPERKGFRGFSRDHSEVSGIIAFGSNDSSHKDPASRDWVLLRLKKNLGDKYGWMEVAVPKNYLKGVYNVAGYSRNKFDGREISVDHKTHFRKWNSDGTLAHDGSLGVGCSGGPIFTNDGKIVATQSGAGRGPNETEFYEKYSDDRANSAVPASQFLAVLREAQKDGASSQSRAERHPRTARSPAARLTRESLYGKRFRFSWKTERASSHIGTATLRKDGTIAGISSPNETFWLVDDQGRLVFKHRDGRVSTVFTRAERREGRWIFSGPFQFDEGVLHQLEEISAAAEKIQSEK